jgi:hypothetical protein
MTLVALEATLRTSSGSFLELARAS